MDEDSYILENLQILTDGHDISSNTSLVDGMVNLVPSLIILVDKAVNLVSSLVEPLTKVVHLVPSSVHPTPLLKSATKVVYLVPSLFNPTPHSKSEDVTQFYLVNIDSPGQGDTLPVSMAPPSSNQMISINWNTLTKPCIPSYILFQITM
jgi:hypothetical protein